MNLNLKYLIDKERINMSKSKNQIKGDKYEKFVLEILLLKAITWNDNVNFDTKEESKTIIGKSKASHQIDIHLTSSSFLNEHLLCECKNHDCKVTKILASAFVTIIDDIKNNHKDWNIVPVFVSNKGFQKGALQILKEYNVTSLYLEDVSDKEMLLTIKETYIRPIIEITKVTLIDGSEVNINETFYNNDIAETHLTDKDIINYYKWYDDNEKEIIDRAIHKGNFHTKDRTRSNVNEYDHFISNKYNKEIGRIEVSVV